MEQMLQLKKNHEKKFQEGYPLLFPEAVKSTRPLQKKENFFNSLHRKASLSPAAIMASRTRESAGF